MSSDHPPQGLDFVGYRNRETWRKWVLETMNKKLFINAFTLAAMTAGWLFFLCAHTFSQKLQEQPKDLTQIPIEDLSKLEVYSASKLNQAISEAPAAISIVTAADIQHYGYRSMADVIKSTTGFFVTNDRNYNYIAARGFGRTGDYNSRVLILIDGHRLNENIYNSVGIGADFPIPIDLIDRIEIVRGPGSSLYGTNAFFATINVITKRGRIYNGGSLSGEARSFGTYVGTAAYGEKFQNGLEMTFSSSYLNSKGHRQLYYPEFDTPESNHGIAQDVDTERSVNAFADISYRGFTTQLVYYSRNKHFPTAAFETAFNDRRSYTIDSGGYVDVKYERSYKDRWNFLARTSMDAYFANGEYPYYYSADEPSLIALDKDSAQGRWWGGEVQVTRKFSGRHHIMAGNEWRYSFRANQLNYDKSPAYVLYLDSKERTTDSGTYIQAEIAVRNNLLLSMGVRYDHYSTFGGSTNPRFAAVYSPQPKTTLKLLYGHAFRAPNLYELYCADAISSKANPRLQPENIHTTELVIEKAFGNNSRISASGYHYTVDQLIAQQIDPADGLLMFGNSGDMHAHGIEFEFESKNFHRVDSRFSYALQKGSVPVGAKELVNSPRHSAQINLYVPVFRNKAGIGGEISHMSARKTLAGNQVEGLFLANVTLLHTRIFSNLSLSASIYNIFDKHYSDPAGNEHKQDSIPQDGRSFRIRIGYGFPVK
jgi:outer membrane receptor for ferrienterochelin and colicins